MQRKPKIMRRILLAVLACLGLAFIVAVWVVGGHLVAPANRTVGPPPDDFPCETITIESESGSKLAAWYAPEPAATATVILLHPVRSDRRSILGRARFFAEAEDPKRLVVFENATHEDLMAFDRERYETEVGGFFEMYLK